MTFANRKGMTRNAFFKSKEQKAIRIPTNEYPFIISVVCLLLIVIIHDNNSQNGVLEDKKCMGIYLQKSDVFTRVCDGTRLAIHPSEGICTTTPDVRLDTVAVIHYKPPPQFYAVSIRVQMSLMQVTSN
jgi:hypothetical protein